MAAGTASQAGRHRVARPIRPNATASTRVSWASNKCAATQARASAAATSPWRGPSPDEGAGPPRLAVYYVVC